MNDAIEERLDYGIEAIDKVWWINGSMSPFLFQVEKLVVYAHISLCQS